MFAGGVNSFVVGPIELVKCRLQLQFEDSAKSKYKGPLDCVRKIIADEGFTSLYQGMVATLLREIACYAAQFGGYFYAKRIWADKI
jgi:solute carrier family 25 carnitine/acylcarnitine transporter 20/29